MIKSRHGPPLTTEEIEEKIQQQIPKATMNSAQWAKRTFNSWLVERNSRILNMSESSELLFLSKDGHSTLSDLTKSTLNEALKFFFFEVRKRNGDVYPSDTLRCLLTGLNYCLSNIEKKTWNLWTDEEFKEARISLDAAMKKTSQEGHNPRRKRAGIISTEQENNLWERHYLGEDNPRKLNRNVLYLLSVHCGLRGGRELRDLRFGENAQIVLKKVDDVEFLEYTESYTKTYKHGLRSHHIEPKIVKV